MDREERDLKYLDPFDISFAADNPRGETSEQIESDPQYRQLTNSINQYGLIEPLIVRPDQKDPSKYVLIDGERRLRAAHAQKQSEIPAIVVKGDIDGKILAYQVHTLRKNWSKAAETKSIKRIIEDIRQEEPDIMDGELKKRLKAITGHTSHALSDILKIANFDNETIDKAVSKNLNMSYLVQIESNFIKPLRRQYPEIIDRYGEHELRKIMVQKALDDLLVSTRFLMDKFKVVFGDKANQKQVGGIICSFLEKRKRSIRDALQEYNKVAEAPEKAEGKGRKPPREKAKKREGKPQFFKAIKLEAKDQTRIGDVKSRIESIAGALSNEENEYVAEAVYCLESRCFKAATIMIWATGISKVLRYIERDLSDFIKASKEMRQSSRSVYRHISKNFQTDARTVDDVREKSNDRQLLSYLYYRGMINAPEFHKLEANYKTRCHCAHPTAIQLSPNEVIVVFENVLGLVLSNRKLDEYPTS